MLQPGNAGSNTAADHIEATRLALVQIHVTRRRQVLVRTDSAGAQARPATSDHAPKITKQ